MNLDAPQEQEQAEKRKQELQSSIEERNRQRLETARIRKETTSQGRAAAIEAFTREFQDYLAQVDAILSSSDSATASSIDQMLEQIAKAKELLGSSSSFLTGFDIDRSQAKIDEYDGKIQEKRNMGTKKKFAFKSAKKSVSLAPSTEEAPKPAPVEKVEVEEAIDPNRSVVDLTGQTIVIGEDKLGSDTSVGDYSLARLSHCTIKLVGLTTALRLSYLQNCIIIAAPVKGSIFVQHCSNIIVHSASRQLRIHDTTGSTFFIYTQSRPTIESCNDMLFGPYQVSHAKMEEWMRQCDYALEKNEWEDVQDFHWLKATESPHWRKVDASKREVVQL